MQPRKRETIQSVNTYISDLFANGLDCELTMTLFNAGKVEVRYLKTRLGDVAIVPLSEDNYKPMDNTPLLDAIGKTIKAVGDEKECIFVIFTDGEENASREYTKVEIRRLIEDREGRGWKFVFFGIGGMDSVAEAGQYGLSMNSIVQTQTWDTVSSSTRGASAVTMAYAAAPMMGASISAQSLYDAAKKEDEEALKKAQQKAEADRLTRKLKGTKSA
jgi:hypothetical protein